MSWTPRRVVTGHDANGKSVFLSDGVPPVGREIPERGVSFVEYWNTNASPAPIAATEPEPTDRPIQVPPRPNGTIIRINVFQPGFSTAVKMQSPMHRTKTIDYGIVLEGEIWSVLDDSETLLKAGDVIIQRGTDHAWDNRSDKIAKMAFILVDAEFTEDLKAILPEGALDKLYSAPTAETSERRT